MAAGRGRSRSRRSGRRATASRPRRCARSVATSQRGSASPRRCPRYPEVVPGDRLTIEGSIRPRPDSPYGEYLERIGAIGTLTARSMSVEHPPAGPIQAIGAARLAAAAALATVLPEPEAGLAAGILIGLRDRVDRDLAAAFTTAGVSHVVAISGWNIAIVAAAIAALAGRMRRRRRSVLTMIAIVAYVAFAGASAVGRACRRDGRASSCSRARSGRAGRAAAALGWAAVLLLIADPALVRDAGFQLSAAGDRRPDRLGDAADRVARPGRARSPAALAGREPRRVARGAGRDPPHRAGVVRAACDPLAGRQPAVVPLVAPAMAAGLVAMLGGFLVAIGAAAGRRQRSRRARLGPASAHDRDRRRDGRAAVRERHASGPGGRGRGDRDARRAGRRPCALAWPRSPAACATADVIEPEAAVAYEPATPRSSRRDSGGGRGARDRHRRRGRGGGQSPDRRRPGDRPRRRAGRRDPRRGIARRPAPHRRRPGPGPAAGRARPAHPAVGPADRRASSCPTRTRTMSPGSRCCSTATRSRRVFEPGMRGPGPGYAAWLVAPDDDRARRMRLGLAAGDRLDVDDIDLRVLWPIRGQVPAEPTDGGTGINNVSVVLLGAVGDCRFLLAGDVEEDDRPVPPRRRPAAARPPQGRPPRQPDGDDAGVRRCRPAADRGRLGGGRQPVRPPGASHARSTGRGGGARLPDRPRRHGGRRRSSGSGLTVRAEGGRTVAASVRAFGTRRPIARASCAPIPVDGSRCRSRTPPHADRAAVARPARPAGRPSGTIEPMTVPGARGRRLPPALPGSAALVRAARARRRRGRGLPGGADRRRAGSPVDRRLVEAAALLHDVDKVLPADDPARGAPPRRRLGGWLTRRGHPELARAVAATRSPACSTASAIAAGRRSRSREERIVAYADKRAGPAPRVDGRPVRLVAAAVPARDGPRGTARDGRRLGRVSDVGGACPRGAAGGRRLPGGRDHAGRGPAAALDRSGASGRARGGCGMTTSPLAYLWGDDDLSLGRAVERFAGALATEGGAPLERWDLRGEIGQRDAAARRSSTSGSRRRSCSVAGRWRS